MTNQCLVKGRMVRYMSHGTPVRADGSQAHASLSRPAVVTEVGENRIVGLMVINPTGLFFHPLASGGVPYDGVDFLPGTWHWPQSEEDSGLFQPSASGGDVEVAP